ncbi:MAG: TRAP transporter large permease subunit [Pseudomonadota bacterium]
MTALWMFPVLIAAILTGFPAAFAMLAVATFFGLDTFGTPFIYQLIQKLEEVALANVLAAVPLFIFMGALFEKSGIAMRLFDAIRLWTRRLPGGLAVGAVFMCIIFAAASGVIGATESIVGLLAIPAMLKYRYNKGLISGTICAGGSLGTIIPPSIPAIVIGPVANTSVGDIFVGMMIPGLMLALFYMIYIVVRCSLRPEDGPVGGDDEDDLPLGRKLVLTATVLVPPLFVVIAVLGSIMTGVATPTEAAAMGAAGTLLLTLAYGRLTFAAIWDALKRTVQVSTMILMIIVAGSTFAAVFAAGGGMSAITELLSTAQVGPWMTIALILSIAFLAGFMLDPLVIILIIVPIAAPVVKSLGFDITWFCVVFLVVLQTAYLTPPMAPAIFYLRGIAPPEVRLSDMYRGIAPFLVIQFLVLAIVVAFPQTVLWLPEVFR